MKKILIVLCLCAVIPLQAAKPKIVSTVKDGVDSAKDMVKKAVGTAKGPTTAPTSGTMHLTSPACGENWNASLP